MYLDVLSEKCEHGVTIFIHTTDNQFTTGNRHTVFIHINAPSLLIALPSSLSLQISYVGVLHPSQQPTPLQFRDSEKRCVLVLPQSNTAYEK